MSDLNFSCSSDLARHVVRLALGAGASAAEAVIQEGTEFSARVRLGVLDKLLQASSRKLGLRLFDGKRSAVLATSDTHSEDGLIRAIADTMEMARAASEDPAAGLAPKEVYSEEPPQLPLYFPLGAEWTTEAKIDRARRCEESSLALDTRIRNSEGAVISDSDRTVSYANSFGIVSAYRKTLASLSVTPLAEENGHKQRDYWLTNELDFSRLQSPEKVGVEAARRTLRRLGARKISTCEVPVVFDPLTAASLLKHIADAVSGTAVMRKASFLTERLGTRIAPSWVTIIDDALLPGGIGSRLFDAEGVPSQRTVVVREGILESFLLDSYSARKLKLRTTASSNRELHGGPSVGPSNFYLQAGNVSPDDIIGSVRRGLYVTELIGFGVNVVSGNYSQGAVGLWIEDGRLVFPVEEITIAGNLKHMLTSIEAVGNDLTKLGEIFSPTLLIRRMVVSGS